MKYLLTYYVGSKAVQSWPFYSKSLALWKKLDLIESGSYNSGKFKITEI